MTLQLRQLCNGTAANLWLAHTHLLALPLACPPTSVAHAVHLFVYRSDMGDVERQEREDLYKERALHYHLKQVKESNNV